MASRGRPTIKPKPDFNAEADSQVLRDAMKGLGTDEKAIIGVVTSCDSAQRQELLTKFKTMFGKDLIDAFKSELSGHFKEAILGLMMLPAAYDAKCLQKAMRGLGTDEAMLIEVMCSRTNAELKAIKEAYTKKYGKDLEKDIIGDTSGHFQRLLVSMCQAARDEGTAIDPLKAAEDAAALYEAGEAKLGTDESKFNMIFSTRSYPQLKVTFDEYAKLAGKDIIDSIDSEMSGDLKSGMKAIVKVCRNKAAYFAERIMKAMKGLGTDDRLLVHLIVSRSEIDLQDIKEEFQKNYGKSINEWLEDDISGDYLRTLQAVVGK